MPINITPVTQNPEISQAKPASAKKEFMNLLRSIKGIVAKSRVFSSDFINASQVDMEGQGTKQQYIGFFQAGALVLGTMAGPKLGSYVTKEFGGEKLGEKLGDILQLIPQAFGADIQSVQQRLQQNMTYQNTFEQRAQTLIQTITNFEQQERQKELEQAQFNH